MNKPIDTDAPPAVRRNSTGFENSNRLFERAQRVIPGGIYGHVAPALLEPGASPYYATHAKGCRYWDVDGNEYLDFMCGYGPIVLGHCHPEVEAAVDAARVKGNCFNHPTEHMVELAERLTGLVDFAEWAVFAKNGTDVTTWCTQVAREHTGKRKLLVTKGAYHGSAPWCTPGHGGLIDEDKAHVDTFTWNDAGSVEAVCAKHKADIAAIIITPFHHALFEGSTLPAPDFIEAIHKACKQYGCVLILDDVRAGFRLHLGGSHRVYGWQPDLICFSKALANGYPISSALGCADLRVAASRVFLTGSFWNSPIEMVAALKTIEILERERIPEKLAALGQQLMEGLSAAASQAGRAIEVSGPPALPFMKFTDDADYAQRHAFAAHCFAQGVFFHPHHNWFVSAAHSPEDITVALEVAATHFRS